jgi:hypothetical protein
MFNFFKSRQEHVEELMDAIKDSAYTVAPLEVPTPEKKPSKDFYRVGWNEADQMVTLTLAPEGGFSTTLAITPDECERMIRMLRAAYPLVEASDE